MNPFILKKKTCSKCGTNIDEWTFIGKCLDDSLINNESGGLSFEIETECLLCKNKIFGLLWLVDIYNESQFEKMGKGL